MMKHSTTSPRSVPAITVAFVIAFVLAASVGCSSQPPQITIADPSADLSPMLLGAGSVFLKIRNTGGRDALVGASINIPNSTVELHDVKDNRMVRVEKIAVPSRGTVELRPRGVHLMVFNMPKTMGAGSEVVLTLRFERSGEKQVTLRFEKAKQTQGGR